jgi:hypothetical protein
MFFTLGNDRLFASVKKILNKEDILYVRHVKHAGHMSRVALMTTQMWPIWPSGDPRFDMPDLNHVIFNFSALRIRLLCKPQGIPLGNFLIKCLQNCFQCPVTRPDDGRNVWNNCSLIIWYNIHSNTVVLDGNVHYLRYWINTTGWTSMSLTWNPK